VPFSKVYSSLSMVPLPTERRDSENTRKKKLRTGAILVVHGRAVVGF
jgi:hypothetical protein